MIYYKFGEKILRLKSRCVKHNLCLHIGMQLEVSRLVANGKVVPGHF